MKFLKTLFIVVLAMVGMANTASAQADASTATTEQVVSEIKTLDVKVKGVGCGKDLAAISKNVENLEGVSACKVVKKGATTVFQVFYNPSSVEAKAIHAAVEGTPGCSNPDARPYKVKI